MHAQAKQLSHGGAYQGDLMIEEEANAKQYSGKSAPSEWPEPKPMSVTVVPSTSDHVLEPVSGGSVAFVPAGEGETQSWILVVGGAHLTHKRQGSTQHAPIYLPAGAYMLTRQIESGPEGWRFVED